MRVMTSAAIVVAALAAPAAAQKPSTYDRAIAAGYKATMLCSGLFNGRRTQQSVEALELKGIYPEYAGIVPTLKADIDRTARTVTVAFDDKLPPRRAQWHEAFGCTNYPIASRVSPAKLPARNAGANLAQSDRRAWPMGDAGATSTKPVPPALSGIVAKAFDRASYGRNSETVGVLIVKDGKIVAEKYAPGFVMHASNRTWSVAKSIAGTLVGVAAQQKIVDPAKPANIPEWGDAGEDPRRRITLDQLLRMSSGLHSSTAGNRTDAIYFGGTAVTDETTGWPLEAEPGRRFRYANNDTLLAVRALRAAMGEERYQVFPSQHLFQKLGMTRTFAERDWRGNFVLSSQVWTTPRDLARLGLLYLQDGVWNGERLLPVGWTDYVRRKSGPQPAEGAGYGATFWLYGPAMGLPEGTYAAQGNRGQTLMIVPARNVLIIRRGEDPGTARFDNVRFSADVLSSLK